MLEEGRVTPPLVYLRGEPNRGLSASVGFGLNEVTFPKRLDFPCRVPSSHFADLRLHG